MPAIILGTANFGNQYGIANRGEVLSQNEIKDIIKWAQKNGINHFDTAISYGNAEEILGRYLDLSLEPAIDTKLDGKSCQSRDSIVRAARKTRDMLGVESLSTLYLHDENLLQTSSKTEITFGLREVLDLGIAKQIGVSVYSEEAVKACKQSLPQLSVFQVPENICDRRLNSSRLIHNLSEDGNIFRIRSIFLQGLLLMEPTSIPSNLVQAKSSIQALKEFGKMKSITPVGLCVAYANSISWASAFIVGVASLKQLNEIRVSTLTLPDGWKAAIATLPPEIIDPRKWSK
jgi:aryl-alcohol dehydrogenase-like predicted oxidoreductase